MYDKWSLSFISEEDFIEHTKNTIKEYGTKLEPFDMAKFNKNIIDPIKLIFDKMVYQSSWEEIVKNEIFRQRDKSNNNSIGYFHQKIFKYIKNCEVPDNGKKGGWDVIYTNNNGIRLPDGNIVHRIYVEMKNKHNTMNDAAGAQTYAKCQHQLLTDYDCACYLVEIIAKHSQDIIWNSKGLEHIRIRRVSIDKFYSLVTGIEDAFYQICLVLPDVIEKVIANAEANIPTDTAYNEIKQMAETKNITMSMAFYLLGFGHYTGFENK